MMVLRHLGPPSTIVTDHEDMSQDDDRPPIPMDLSNKHNNHRTLLPPELPRHMTRNPFFSIIPPSIRPLSSPRNQNYIINNNNNNELGVKCNSPHSSNSEESSPRGKGDVWRLRRKDLSKSQQWRDVSIVPSRTEDDINSHSSPDSGLHRDSPGEDEELSISHNPTTPPHLSLRKQSQTLIPLSIIRARYSHRADETPMMMQEEDNNSSSPNSGGRAPDKLLTKRARLEEMVTHIKSSKDRSRRNSGDDDTSSGDHVTSSDEIGDEGRREIRGSNFHQVFSQGGCLNMKREDLNEDELMDDEPCNLVCPESRIRNRTEDLQFDGWKHHDNQSPPGKSGEAMSPIEAAKLLAMDPETYQQQMMQLQLSSAAMLGGDPSALLKGIGPYQPWVYLGYYQQIVQRFQAQEILRQYANMQTNNPLTPNVSQGDKSPNVPRNLGSSRYQCQSPSSPASLRSEGPAGVDSDGSTVGQSTPGSANNGKRAPRAMTGRHVRTGTGASQQTLNKLRQKIEQRQQIKAQEAHNEMLNQPNSKSKNSKFLKKSISKK